MHGTGHRAPASRTVLPAVCAAQLLVVLDVSVVNVALPSIRESLGFSAAGLPWVAHAYTLAFGGLLLLGGRLADVHGHRRAFALGLALFSGASLLGGLAASPAALVLARALQGAGAAVLAPATLAALTTAFPQGPARTRALAAWTAVSVAGGAAGNLVGGLLTEALSWRAVLLVNVPPGAAALVLGLYALDRRRAGGDAGRLDLPGAATATAGLVALAYGLTRVREHGWGDPVTAAVLAGGAGALAAFALVESRAPVPLLPPRLLRDRSVSVGNALTLLAGACFQVPMWYFLTLYMQDDLGLDPLRTGLGFLPHTLVTMAVGWLLTPWLIRHRAPATLITAGCLTAAAGFAWQAAAVSAHSYAAAVLGPAVVLSVGAGLLTTPLTSVVTSSATAGDAGAASGLMNAAKQAGGALGLALLGTAAASEHPLPDHPYAVVFAGLAAVQLAMAALAMALPPSARRRP
ncbi:MULTISPECIES: MFS transporter [unclassified Nocardiopsis]|uniref:MFS transporter n=1 Tax=unclassified Nocardiopsis TaxID=2649073 RepID=UPI001F36E49B|nr:MULTISPECIES: MFS transporter [unclassified Nocardiopsis]